MNPAYNEHQIAAIKDARLRITVEEQDADASLFQSCLIGLMEGFGASEDHAEVKSGLSALPLTATAVDLLHLVIVNSLKDADENHGEPNPGAAYAAAAAILEVIAQEPPINGSHLAQPQPDAFCWATELAMVRDPVTLTVKEAREVSDEMQRMHAENETLRTGYAAARLEIESLRARCVESVGEYPALLALFREALAWGMTYGPEIPAHQWDEMRESMVKQYADRAMRAAQPAGAQQPGAAYAALPESLILAVDRWFADNTGLGGCGDEDVRELAALFYGVTHKGGRETVDDALEIVESFGPGIGGLNDTYARQILLANEVKRLRAPRGQAPAQESKQ